MLFAEEEEEEEEEEGSFVKKGSVLPAEEERAIMAALVESELQAREQARVEAFAAVYASCGLEPVPGSTIAWRVRSTSAPAEAEPEADAVEAAEPAAAAAGDAVDAE